MLLAAGFAVSWWQEPSSRAAGTMAGIDLTKGDAAVAIVGVTALQWAFYEVGNGGERTVVSSAGPDLFSSLLLVAFLYPLVFGAIGGVAAYAVRVYRTEDERSPVGNDPTPSSSGEARRPGPSSITFPSSVRRRTAVALTGDGSPETPFLAV